MSFELKFFFMYAITMTFITLLLGSFFPSNNVSDFDREEFVNNATQDLNFISSIALSSILSSSINTMDLFGVDFIGVIENVPTWLTSIISLYAIMSTLVIIFYFIKILWIG